MQQWFHGMERSFVCDREKEDNTAILGVALGSAYLLSKRFFHLLLLEAFNSNWSSSDICRDLFVCAMYIHMHGDTCKACTDSCTFVVLYFFRDSLISSQCAATAFCWKEGSPVGHLTRGGVRLRFLRPWTFSLLLSPAYLPFIFILCKRCDPRIKILTVGEYCLIVRSGYSAKHGQYPIRNIKMLTSKYITKTRSELEAGEKQGQGGKVEEEVIKFPYIICTQILLPLNHSVQK